MSKKKPAPTISDMLRQTIRTSGVSHYRIGKATGIPATSIMRFMSGETSLRLDRADVLATYLALRLTPDPNAKPPEPTPENLARPRAGRRKAK
jgi:hypothetical protein